MDKINIAPDEQPAVPMAFDGQNNHPLINHANRKKIRKYANFAVIFLLSVGFLCIFLIIMSIYYWHWDNSLVKKISSALPLPAMIAGRDFIWLNEFNDTYSATYRYYQKQYSANPLSIKDLKAMVLTSLLERKIVENKAKDLNISVSQSEINKEISVISQNPTNDNLDQMSQEIFGWSFQEFIDRVIKYELLSIKVNDNLTNDQTKQSDSLKKINYYYAQLKNGIEFTKLGQDLGWFKKEEINDPVFNNIKDLAIGQYTGIIESKTGYFIFKLNNKTIASKNGDQNFELSQIFVRKYNLSDYLSEVISKMRIFQFIYI